MRPGDFSPGNVPPEGRTTIDRRFNEAGGFLPRKLDHVVQDLLLLLASMRPGDFSPGNPGVREAALCVARKLQ